MVRAWDPTGQLEESSQARGKKRIIVAPAMNTALDYIVGTGNLSRFSTPRLINFEFLPMRSDSLASHFGYEKLLDSRIRNSGFVKETKSERLHRRWEGIS